MKGDVLAYLQEIPSSYPAEVQSRAVKLSHLDLSNVKPAASPTAPAPPTPKPSATPPQADQPPPPVALSTQIDLTAVLRVQQKLQDTLGTTLPLSTFIARAVALANEGLPARRGPASADELFHHIVGAPTAARNVRGAFVPQIVALPQAGLGLGVAGPPPPAKRGGGDALFDEIVAPRRSAAVRIGAEAGAALGGAENVFALSVDQRDRKRATVFLERVKSVLEVEPGRLVL